MQKFQKTARTALKRMPARGSYDRELVYRILDEALICHVGFVEGDQPFVIPTIFARDGDVLYFHGSSVSRLARRLGEGINACVTVTLLDGLVLARSAFHHSMNYRSVVILGKALEITDEEEKKRALTRVVEHVVPGRSRDARPPSDQELKATSVLKMELQEVSAKVREGGPKDDDEDYAMNIWAGVLPLRLTPEAPIADDRNRAPLPDYLSEYGRS